MRNVLESNLCLPIIASYWFQIKFHGWEGAVHGWEKAAESSHAYYILLSEDRQIKCGQFEVDVMGLGGYGWKIYEEYENFTLSHGNEVDSVSECSIPGEQAMGKGLRTCTSSVLL